MHPTQKYEQTEPQQKVDQPILDSTERCELGITGQCVMLINTLNYPQYILLTVKFNPKQLYQQFWDPTSMSGKVFSGFQTFSQTYQQLQLF